MLVTAGITPGIQYDQHAAWVTLTPVAPKPLVALMPSLINSTNNHYRMGVDSATGMSPVPIQYSS